jgi:hypothetical protein
MEFGKYSDCCHIDRHSCLVERERLVMIGNQLLLLTYQKADRDALLYTTHKDQIDAQFSGR